MKRTTVITIIFGASLAFAASFSTVGAQQGKSTNDGVYAADQAKRGGMLYADTCAACHDEKLVGGIGPALAGKDFIGAWKDKAVGDLFTKIKVEMPLTAPGTLTPEQTADVVSFILSSNQFPAGATALAADAAALKDIDIAEPAGGGGGARGASASGAAPSAAASASTPAAGAH